MKSKAQKTMDLFEWGEQERAYQLFLTDNTAIKTNYKAFCERMRKAIKNRKEWRESEKVHSGLITD